MKTCHTIVIGGGIVGVTTAYELARRGHLVTLLEAQHGVGNESSFANGALLTAGMSNPWNGPGVYRELFASLFDEKAALKLHLAAVPSMVGWGLRFLGHSSRSHFVYATQANFHLANYSIRLACELDDALEFKCLQRGVIKVFRDNNSIHAPLTIAKSLAQSGLQYELLDAKGAIACEPQLEQIAEEITGALHFSGDAWGDAYVFCQNLSNRARNLGACIRTGIRVVGIDLNVKSGVAVNTSEGRHTATCVIVAAGCQTPKILASIGLNLPIAPAKGYSLTLPLGSNSIRPHMPIIDESMHAAVVPMDGKLRLVGTAEFAGFDRTISKARVDNLRELLGRILPKTAEHLQKIEGETWVGFRPMSADGVPFIGPLVDDRVFVNAGHGHLGWTLAMGSAHLLADQIDKKKPIIPFEAYLPERRRSGWTLPFRFPC